MRAAERVDAVVIGSGFGGAVPAYHLAAAGAKVVILERGPHLRGADLAHDFRLGTFNRLLDAVVGDGLVALAGNCVGGGSVHYFAVSLRAPSFVFKRRGSLGRRLWPEAVTRSELDPWYDRAEEALPVSEQRWDDVSYAGGVLAAACDRAGRTCQPVPLAVDNGKCVDCNWMIAGCRFDAKRSVALNYIPAAQADGAGLRPLHEVQRISPAPGYGYRLDYHVLDGDRYHRVDSGSIEARVVVVAAGAVATPVLLRRSAGALGGMPRAVGRHLSANGDMFVTAQVDEAKVASLLGLAEGYAGYPIGKSITTQTMDRLDPSLPEFERFSIQQCYLPPLANIFPAVDGKWFGRAKKEARRSWRSWLGTLSMSEDDNEGVFGPPPSSGAFVRLAPGAGLSPLRFRPNRHTRRGWKAVMAEHRAILERDGLARLMPWTEELIGAITAHPLSSARIGDDPSTSALDQRHELRGHRGIFVTDGSAVPTSLCVNPSLTIAALAERAAPYIVDRLAESGAEVKYRGTTPSP